MNRPLLSTEQKNILLQSTNIYTPVTYDTCGQNVGSAAAGAAAIAWTTARIGVLWSHGLVELLPNQRFRVTRDGCQYRV